MYKYMLMIKKIFFTLLMLIFLQSCGGSSDNSKYTIAANKTSVTFSNEFQETSTDTVKIEVSFKGEGLLLGFSPGSPAVQWLKFRTENVTDETATIYLDVINSDKYPPNLYKTELRLSTGTIDSLSTAVDLVHQDIDVSMLVAQLVSFKTVVGKNAVPSQTTTLISESNDSWEISENTEWLEASLSVNQESKALTITSSANVESLTELGLYNTNIILKNTTTNEEYSIPVELGLDNIYLYSDQSQISLVSTPNVQLTDAIITISNNAAKTIDWQASTSAEWLTITPINDGKQLKISADISNIIENQTSFAEISITASNENEAIAETVHVNLFHSTSVTERKPLNLDNLPVNDNAIRTSPAKPYVYIGIKNEIRVFHLYTGQLLNTITASPEGTKIEKFVIHPDGSIILAQATQVDSENAGTTKTLRYKVDLSNNTIDIINNWNIAADPIRIVRLTGRYFVLTRGLEYADLNLNFLYWNSEEAFSPSKIDFAQQTGAIYATDNSTNGESAKIKRFEVDVNDYTKEIISSSLTHSYHPESLSETAVISDIAITSDEKNIYIVSDSSEWISFDGMSFTDHGLLQKENVVLSYDEDTQTLIDDDITSTDDDITTHSVYVNNENKPHYIRTIKLPNESPEVYETYINAYNNEQQLITNIFTTKNGQVFNISPIDINFSISNKHIVVYDKTSNEVKFNLAPFIPDTYQIVFDVPLSSPENDSFTVSLKNIDNNWIILKNANWINLTQDISKQELIVELTNYESLEAGVYHDELTVYDITNQVSATIRVTLNIE